MPIFVECGFIGRSVGFKQMLNLAQTPLDGKDVGKGGLHLIKQGIVGGGKRLDRLLMQIANALALGQLHLPITWALGPCQHPQQRGFADAICPNQANFGLVRHRHTQPLKYISRAK